MDVDQAVVELYGGAPEEFTAARDALVTAARDAGDLTTSGALKALRKPTLAAWLANQLVRAEPDRIDQLTTLGDELRAAHLSGDGARLRKLTPRRHALIRDLVQAARTLAEAAGRSVTQPVAERLTETLDAALVDPDAARLLRTGRLTSGLRHVGFGVVDETGRPAWIPPAEQPPRPTVRPAPIRAAKPARATKAPARVAKRPARKPPDPGEVLRRRQRELEQLAVEAAGECEEAEAARAAAEAELDANEHHVADMRMAIERLNDELARVRQELTAAQRSMPALERRVKLATRAADKAARRRDLRRQRLADLGA